MKKTIIPNVFLIGIQKSATTSFYNWVSQHPQVCGPESIKDVGFFSEDRLFKKGLAFLSNEYKREYQDEEIILHGNVNYIFFEEALSRIKALNQDSKFIVVLRNPIERAISAYNFFVQRGLETRSIEKSFQEEEKLYKNASFQELCDFTYKSHGLYYKQLVRFLNFFKREQLLILFFEDIKRSPLHELEKTFDFLSIDNTFKPNLVYQNKTGTPRIKAIQKLIHGENRIKKFFVTHVLDKLISLQSKNLLKSKLSKLFLKDKKAVLAEVSEDFRKELQYFYKDDIASLETFLQINLSHWK